MIRRSKSKRVFDTFNVIFLVATSVLCLAPIIHILALSFSDSAAAASGNVVFWPVKFTLESYKYAMGRVEFAKAFLVTTERVLLGVGLNMLLTILTAYPLCHEKKDFPHRNLFAWFFFITMVFNGGLIPTYMVINKLGILDSLWALVLPGALPVFNMIIMLNFFRQLPKEISESAFVDGASHWTVLWKIFVPLSKPSIATLTLFALVGHWNSWFDGLVFMTNPENYPLQTYLHTIIVQKDFTLMTSATLEELQAMAKVSDKTSKAAQIFIASIPVLAAYPFLQKYFVKGLVIGSVKG